MSGCWRRYCHMEVVPHRAAPAMKKLGNRLGQKNGKAFRNFLDNFMRAISFQFHLGWTSHFSGELRHSLKFKMIGNFRRTPYFGQVISAPPVSAPMTHYFSSLKAFARFFETGLPIVMYHKLGPRPPCVRLKGLYVGKALFAKQLAELRTGGFHTPEMRTAINWSSVNSSRQILLTFDDGFQNVLEHGLEPLAKNGFQAIQFLVPNLLGKSNEWEQRDGEVAERLMDIAQVRDWLAAGHEIGSHTLTHPWLTQLPIAQAREEIVASKKYLEDVFGRSVNHFCYPYGDWNEAVCDLVREAGYQTAVTTEFGVNGEGARPLALKRITARYPSRNWKALTAWVKRLLILA